MKTVLQELINEFENIKLTKCKTMQEMMFFDGVLSIIESKYIGKEKQQIEKSFNDGLNCNVSGATGEEYYKINYENTHKNLRIQ